MVWPLCIKLVSYNVTYISGSEVSGLVLYPREIKSCDQAVNVY